VKQQGENMTKRIFLLIFLTAAMALAQGTVYELRTYTTPDGKLEDLKARFKNHTIRIFKNHGMESVGYWVPQDPERSKNTLIYILKHPSREEGLKHWTEFQNDPEWKKVSAESEANGKIVLKVERVWLDPTEFSALK
jgi:NIPSNAP protein